MNNEERGSNGIYKLGPADDLSASGSSVRRGPGPDLMGANTLIGNEVFNLQGQNIGAVKEIMLDMRSGHVGYAVLSFGGFLTLGEKLFAVPWAALTLDTEFKRFTMDASVVLRSV